MASSALVTHDARNLMTRLRRPKSLTDYLLFFVLATLVGGLAFAWMDGLVKSLVSMAVFTAAFLVVSSARQ
jgi:hypothetical protein